MHDLIKRLIRILFMANDDDKCRMKLSVFFFLYKFEKISFYFQNSISLNGFHNQIIIELNLH